MKSYTITVNGTAYEVTVEETGSVSAPAAAPVAAPKKNFSERRSPWRMERRSEMHLRSRHSNPRSRRQQSKILP